MDQTLENMRRIENTISAVERTAPALELEYRIMVSDDGRGVWR